MKRIYTHTGKKEAMEIVMNLTGCTEEEAKHVLRECDNDVIEAVDRLWKNPVVDWTIKKKERTDEQKRFDEMRKTMETIDRNVEAGLMKKDQPDFPSCRASNYTHTPHSQQPSSDSNHTLQNQTLTQE